MILMEDNHTQRKTFPIVPMHSSGIKKWSALLLLNLSLQQTGQQLIWHCSTVFYQNLMFDHPTPPPAVINGACYVAL